MSDVSRFSDVEAAKIAVALEKDGRAFYLAVAENALDSTTRRLLLHLAEAEAMHQARFEALEQKLLLGGGSYWDDPDVTEYIRALVDTKVFPRHYDPRALAERLSNEKAVFEFALQIEKDSVLFYGAAAEHTGDASTRAVFGEIRKEEEKHVVWVSERLRKVARPPSP